MQSPWESGPESLQRQHMSNPPGHTHCAPERAFAEFFRAVPRRNSIELAQDCLLDFRKNAIWNCYVEVVASAPLFTAPKRPCFVCSLPREENECICLFYLFVLKPVWIQILILDTKL